MLHAAPATIASTSKPAVYLAWAIRVVTALGCIITCVLAGGLIVEAPPLGGEQLAVMALTSGSFIALLASAVVALERRRSPQ